MDAIVLKLVVGVGIPETIGWLVPVLFGVVNVLPIILKLFLDWDRSSEYSAVMSGQKTLEPTYDFIIVGGGVAGSVLANRLSKDFKVLLLERGGEPNPLTQVPGLQAQLLGRPELDYSYLTTPQSASCLASKNQQMNWHSGRGLGGGSIVNDQIYIRPGPHDFNRLARFINDSRWNYKNVLPYFLRSERICEEPGLTLTPTIIPKYHSTNGELPVGASPYPAMVSQFLDALGWAGAFKGDLNAPYNEPIGDIDTYAIKNGRRIDTYKAFVKPILKERTSLTVMKYARVIQVTFEPGTNRASGVKFERFGKVEIAMAREIILSAGVIETPKILSLSGIGPEKDLLRLNIPVRVNLPVGENLQNHVGTIVGPFIVDKPLSIIPERDVVSEAVRQFLQNGTGPLSTPNPRASTLWISSRTARSKINDWPDIHIHFTSNGVSQNVDQEYSRIYNMDPEVMKEFLTPLKGKDAFTLIIYPSRPKSRGVVQLKSSDYEDDPLIDPRTYEGSNRDIEILVEGIQRAVSWVESAPSFKRIGARLSPIPFPTCRDYTFKSPSYWECVVKSFTVPEYHYAGTAAMGSVLDSELRVLGTKGLRVVDGSVLPFLVSTNTYATTLMIAEKGADLIIEANLKGRPRILKHYNKH